MTDQRTKTRLAVSEFQSALRARFDADRDFTLAHDKMGKLIDDLIAENEGLRRVIALEAPYTLDAPFEGNEELCNLRRKLGLVTP